MTRRDSSDESRLAIAIATVITSASPGEPENRARFGYEPASWIEVFATGPDTASSWSPRGGRRG